MVNLLVPFITVINKTPVIDSKTLSYVSISQLATNGQQVTKIYASDPEKSTLYYYVSEVKYYESITSKPQSAFSLPFGYTTCDLQQNLPFPRNMFCLNYITGVISTTTMFSKMKPEGDSIFVLEVVVLDSGDQQMNVSTQITIHISKNCTAGNSFYLRLIKNCPAGQDGVTLTGLFANMTDRHRLSVPKANTFLVGLEVDPGYFRRTPVNVGEVVTFNITYPTNSSQKTIIIKPRLLFNPVVSGQGTKWKIFFENREKTDKDFTRVMISISKQNGIGIIGFTYQFSLLGVLDKKYCDQSDCFSDYVGWRNALLASKNKVCLIGSNFVHERYQTCKGKFTNKA